MLLSTRVGDEDDMAAKDTKHWISILTFHKHTFLKRDVAIILEVTWFMFIDAENPSLYLHTV